MTEPLLSPPPPIRLARAPMARLGAGEAPAPATGPARTELERAYSAGQQQRFERVAEAPPFTFAELRSDPAFQTLPPQAQEQARGDYFREYVQPTGKTWEDFTSDAQPGMGEQFMGATYGLLGSAQSTVAFGAEKLGYGDLAKEWREAAEANERAFAAVQPTMPHGNVGVEQIKNVFSWDFWEKMIAQGLVQAAPSIAATSAGGAGGAALGTAVAPLAGPAAPIMPVVGAVVGGMLGIASVTTLQTLGSSYYEYLDQNPGDTDGASAYALKQAGWQSAYEALSVPLYALGYGLKPVLHGAVQFLAQSMHGAGSAGVENLIAQEIDPGRPLSTGMLEEAVMEGLFEAPGVAAAWYTARGRPAHELPRAGGGGRGEPGLGPEGGFDGTPNPMPPERGQAPVQGAPPIPPAGAATTAGEAPGMEATPPVPGEEPPGVGPQPPGPGAVSLEEDGVEIPGEDAESFYGAEEPGLDLEPAPGAELTPAQQQVDDAADEAATSPFNEKPEPTEPQKSAGNYPKGHIKLHGLDISVENPAGSTRSGTDKAGKPWSIDMIDHYGYIRRTEGKDGEQVDAFIGPKVESERVFVVDQVDPGSRRFDEHKVILGAESEAEARQIYQRNYEEGWEGLGAVKEMGLDEFKTWLKEGDTTQRVSPRNELVHEPDTSAPAAPETPVETAKTPETSAELEPELGTTALGGVSERDTQIAREQRRSPAPPQPRPAERKAKRAGRAAVRDAIRGKTETAETPAGRKIETQWALVDLDDLIASHDEQGARNPAYPTALQPRDRERVASRQQIAGIVARFNPERAGRSPLVSEGAPVIGPDGVVESGNARTLALRELYRQGREGEYRAMIEADAEALGLAPGMAAEMSRPVLVRLRKTGMSPGQRAQFAREANEPSVAQMSASERAATDAAKIARIDLLSPSEDGRLDAASNAEFIRHFIEDVVPASERGAVVTPDGTLSQEGVVRMRGAVFVLAYGDRPVAMKLMEDPDSNIRSITNAMVAVAPRASRLRAGIRKGARFDLPVYDVIADAAEAMAGMRDSGETLDGVLGQTDLLGARWDAETLAALHGIEDNKRSAKKLGALFGAWIDAVEKLGSPQQESLLGDAERPTLQAALEAGSRRFQEAVERAETAQGQLFAGEPADQAPGRQPAGNAAEPESAAAQDLAPGDREGAPAESRQRRVAPEPLSPEDIQAAKQDFMARGGRMVEPPAGEPSARRGGTGEKPARDVSPPRLPGDPSQRRRTLQALMEAEATRIFGAAAPRIEIVKRLTVGGERAVGAYYEARHLIKMALEAPAETFSHEAIHAAVRLGLIPPEDMAVLERTYRGPEGQRVLRHLEKVGSEAAVRDARNDLEERVAYAGGFYRAGTLKPPAAAGRIFARAFETLEKALEWLRAAFTKAGYRTAQDVFDDLFAGKFAQRSAAPQAAQAAASRAARGTSEQELVRRLAAALHKREGDPDTGLAESLADARTILADARSDEQWRQDWARKELRELLGEAGMREALAGPAKAARMTRQQRVAAHAPVSLMDRAVAMATYPLRPVERAVFGAVDFLEGRLSRFETWERAKAGIVSRYGQSKEARAAEETRQRAERIWNHKISETGKLLMAMFDSYPMRRVLSEWLQEKPNTARWQALAAGLTPEQTQVADDVRRLIRDLGQEAVRVGGLSQAAFQRNEFAYLHRMYAEYELDDRGRITKERARLRKVLGDQYKGRGLHDLYEQARLVSDADPSLQADYLARGAKRMVGKKFHRYNLWAATGRLRRRGYVEIGAPVPAVFQGPGWALDVDKDGVTPHEWEARWSHQGKAILWRDFSKAEQQEMGVIDDGVYAVVRTLQKMTRDIETARYFQWLARAKDDKGHPLAVAEKNLPAGAKVAEASEALLRSYLPSEWVKVPETTIPKTGTPGVKRYGALAGKYVQGPVWNDLRQVANWSSYPAMQWFQDMMRIFKMSKTALSLTVHTNNVMSNVWLMDMNDLGPKYLLQALQLQIGAVRGDQAAKDALRRLDESGARMGSYAMNELSKEVLEPLEKQLREEMGMVATNNHALAGTRALALLEVAKQGVKKGAGVFVDAYQFEDDLFRHAMFLQGLADGLTDAEAGLRAKDAFLNYDINAPWVNIARQSVLPFLSFTYLMLPKLYKTMRYKPWKMYKWALVLGALNAFGYALSGGDEDEERRLLPPEKQGWLMGVLGPKLLRMPWNWQGQHPLFLDLTRWTPFGDIFSVEQTQTAIPILPWLNPSGPIALFAELWANHNQWTGDPIWRESDTWDERSAKVAGHLYRHFAPNSFFIPRSYSWDRVGFWGSEAKRTDPWGREYSQAMAWANSVGVKIAAYPADVQRLNAVLHTKSLIKEIEGDAFRDGFSHARGGLSADAYKKRMQRHMAKALRLKQELNEKVKPNAR